MGNEFIKVTDARKYFSVKNNFGQIKTVVKAVDDVSLSINRGETLGLVGESGSGKTTLGRSIIQLETIDSGSIVFDGVEMTGLDKKEKQKMMQRMQIIFQDPYSSLNPRMTALQSVMEPLTNTFSEEEAKEKAIAILEKVGLKGDAIYKYPREFSGGQRQRIGIARAVVVEPEFILCDEPISALDVSIQAQIINLLKELQEQLGLTYLFISHDLSMVRYISDRIAVMYFGKLVEIGPAEEIFNHPAHPYTKSLLSAIPIPDPKEARNQWVTESEVEVGTFNIPDNAPMIEVGPDHYVVKEEK